MATDDANFVGACRGTRVQELKNHQKPTVFAVFLARVARRRGRLRGPLWADLAEILRGDWARVWLLTMRISLGRVEVRGRSGRKRIKIDGICRF